MHEAASPASIATAIAIGTSLLAGSVSIWVAMGSSQDATAPRHLAVSILFALALMLILVTSLAAALIALFGTAYVGLLKAALLMTASFAAAGMAMGLIRGLQSAKAINSAR